MIEASQGRLLQLTAADALAGQAGFAERIRRRIERFKAPRDRRLAFNFIGRMGPLGRLLVYGAGAHTELLLPLLEDFPGTTVVGLIDRRWEALRSLRGYPVIAPEQVSAVGYDHVLVANDMAEEEMVARLEALEVPRDRIRTVYSHPDFTREALAAGKRDLLNRIPAGTRYVILAGTPGGLFSSSDLIRHLPPDRTIILAYPQPYALSLHYPSFDLAHSLGLLVEVLEAIQPEVVYTRTQFTTHFLAHLARTVVPGARLIQEFHDFALVTPSDALVDQVCGSEEELETVRLAELDCLASGDPILSKYGGPVLDHLVAITGARHHLVYPYLQRDILKGPTLPTEPIRVVYAGQLYPPGFPPLLKTEWNYLPLLVRMARTGRFQVEAYNSVHTQPSEDGRFQAFWDADRDNPGFTYHRALGYRPTITRLAAAHWGFLYNDAPRADNLSRQVAIAARLTGYLNAGLPVIMDDHHTFMAELVRRFGAGIVHPVGDPEGAVAALLSAHGHLEAHREGARRLHAHMVETNERVLSEVWA